MKTRIISAALLAAASVVGLCGRAIADPLPGEVLKFQQLPLNNGLAPSVGGAPYYGHDEWSTANFIAPGGYQGTFMADDFSDKVSTSVYHIKWWGSYDQNQNFAGVQKFLISFESDLPFDPQIGASRPDQPLLTQVVTPGALSPGSGTFTEQLINGNAPEHLYQYNAELAIPFNEQADTVYWVKIVALVDPSVEGPINWGWHNRDYALQNTLASPIPNPGENLLGSYVDTTGNTIPIWHFQDDAVAGRINVTGGTAALPWTIQQANYTPTNYVHQNPGAVPGVDGPFGIQNYSQDLAFELYTRVPEPGTVALMGMGGVGLAFAAWTRRRRR